MVVCSVIKCKSRSLKGRALKFFRFPKSKKIANAWLQFCKPNTNVRRGRMCALHFLASDYKWMKHKYMNKIKRKLKPNAVPSRNIKVRIGKGSAVLPYMHLPTASKQTKQICIYTENPTGPLLNDCTELTEEPTTSQASDVQPNETSAAPKAECKCPQKEQYTYTNTLNKLEIIFTPGQIRYMPDPNIRHVKSSADDIGAALSFKKISPEDYLYVRDVGKQSLGNT